LPTVRKFTDGGAQPARFGDPTKREIQQLNLSHTCDNRIDAVNARDYLFPRGPGTFDPQHTALGRIPVNIRRCVWRTP